MVGKLTADVADLSAIIIQKDSTISRLRKSVDLLSVAKPESSGKKVAQADIRIRPPTKPALTVNWPKAENWGWRGLFIYLAFEVIRQSIK